MDDYQLTDMDNLVDLEQARHLVRQLRARIERQTAQIDAHHQASAVYVSEINKLNARVDELQQEAIECDELRMKMSSQLRGVALALKGEPASLHSWHDLPEVAQQAVADLRERDRLTSDLGDLLTRTVAVFRGPPGPDASHSWHDLPELAQAAVEQNGTAAIRAACAPLEFWWTVVECLQQELGSAPPISDNAQVLYSSINDTQAVVTAGQLRAMFAAIYPVAPPA